MSNLKLSIMKREDRSSCHCFAQRLELVAWRSMTPWPSPPRSPPPRPSLPSSTFFSSSVKCRSINRGGDTSDLVGGPWAYGGELRVVRRSRHVRLACGVSTRSSRRWEITAPRPRHTLGRRTICDPISYVNHPLLFFI